ncbi:hypothetical protein MW887_004656 [Aspergillus wentii]|nr:hypothetical protein MW887_004656 [Aspergillus wentii]
MGSLNYNYSFHHISKDQDQITTSIQRYKALRLKALLLSPTSFSSTYAIESAFADAEWASRLTADERETFVCAATLVNCEQGSSNEPEWVAQVTLRGPLSKDEFTLPDDSGQPAPRADDKEERWQMLSLFSLPDHRGMGIGKQLCREALGYLRSYRNQPGTVRVRLMVKPEKQDIVDFYRRLGFVEAGRSTLVEALIANGDESLLPDDTRGEKYTTRGPVIMMLELFR